MVSCTFGFKGSLQRDKFRGIIVLRWYVQVVPENMRHAHLFTLHISYMPPYTTKLGLD